MLVCGIDFETTGLDTEKERITEVGCVILDAANNWESKERLSFFVYEPDYAPQTPEVIELTGITDEILKREGITFQAAHIALDRFVKGAGAQFFVAHNAAYDRAMYMNECKRHGFEPSDLHWVCTFLDLKSNRKFKSNRLMHLALDYGCTVNPKILHRAVNDVELMGQMLAEAKANLQEMVDYGKTPNIVVRAMIPAPWEDGGRGKNAAQALGYTWERPKHGTDTFPKQWVKTIKESEFEDEQRGASFTIKRVK